MKSRQVCERVCKHIHLLDRPQTRPIDEWGVPMVTMAEWRKFYRWKPEVGIKVIRVSYKWDRGRGKFVAVENWRQFHLCRDCLFNLEHVMATQQL